MRYLKLFEELNIKKKDFPENGYRLNSREKQILEDLVGEEFLKEFQIRKEDNYYYTSNVNYCNQLSAFNGLKDYILFRYYVRNNKPNEIMELLQSTDLDPSFDDNLLIGWASYYGHIELVKLLLKDHRMDPSDRDNYAIKGASRNGYSEIVRLLINNPRVAYKFSPKEFNKYFNEIS